MYILAVDHGEKKIGLAVSDESGMLARPLAVFSHTTRLADIIKVAMINLYREMKERGLKSKMLLQVHDELVFEVPESELKEMQELVPRLMSTAIKLSIPVKVDTKVGRNWGEMK